MIDLNKEERHPGDFIPAGFDPGQAIRILGDYLQNLEKAFEDIKKQAVQEKRQNETEVRALMKTKDDQQQEIERLTNDLMELTNAMEEQESSLMSANQKAASFEKQLKKILREHSDLESRFTQKENDANFYRQELERHTQDHDSMSANVSSMNNRMEELERRLAAERNVGLTHEKEARRLALALSESQGKNGITEQKLVEAQEKYNDEIKRLGERMNTDAQHEVALLKKRVRSSVAPEMRDLDKMFSEKLSIEVASNFKALLSRMVAKLEQAGLELKP